MGRSKRKTNSPLLKEGSKTRKTAEEEMEEVEELDSASQAEQVGDKIEELKKLFRNENVTNNKKLAEDIRRHNDERMGALETSLAFALDPPRLAFALKPALPHSPLRMRPWPSDGRGSRNGLKGRRRSCSAVRSGCLPSRSS